MTTVAIISEYNPFHNGHKYQIDKIREQFGQDTRIIAIMSGNFTQRGELAIADKGLRAACAVDCGVNLVLELPFPYSMSSAEFFARAGVSIADKIGIVDYISFGSECGSVDTLSDLAKLTLSEEYRAALNNISASPKAARMGYAEICERALRAVISGGKKTDFDFSPNNILGLEYIKAILTLNSDIKPHTIKRLGAGYNETEVVDGSMQSASAIRNAISKKDTSAFDYIPEYAKEHFYAAFNNGELPTDENRLSTAVITSFRLNTSESENDFQDATGGLYNRIRAASFDANNIQALISLTETKKYTRARIRRAMWNSFFGVTSSDMKDLPMYTQVLAMDTVGRTMLKEIGKRSSLHILTKPSRTDGLDERALLQKKMSDRADSVFQLTKPTPSDADTAIKFTPYVKK